jgi:hypothetical protein
VIFLIFLVETISLSLPFAFLQGTLYILCLSYNIYMYIFNVYIYTTGDILLGDGRRTHGVAHILRYLADPQRVLKNKDCCNRLLQKNKNRLLQ